MSLTFVPTPLGNLRDITLRALDVLAECDLIVAEDTRVARRLLAALDLAPKPIWSYREQNAPSATESILERARLARVAVVTDAGMPGISDPGRELVAA
ncbi:MAG: 16S rRNA (cytidine(1402)-2'-O)-methyltransferase, partial [Candidatus Eremiobacteraeota bacterium]|nr:16S rRNA (cytidine(1402)-2'-O)-methyltransferase [Candidatus Eremiobacteraeota bacterium]